MRADLNMQLAVWMEEAFAAQAAEWEKLFAGSGGPLRHRADFAEWMNCSWRKTPVYRKRSAVLNIRSLAAPLRCDPPSPIRR